MKTKKNKLSNLLKIGVLLFGISLLLLNCEKEELTTSNSHSEIETNLNQELDFNMESVTYNQANSESIFSKLKTKFGIDEPILNPKNGSFYSKLKKTHSNSKKSKDFSDLDVSIDMSSLKKITTENYTSYTMRFVESQDNSNSFSNIVVQENNGVQEIFTVRYTPSKALAKTSVTSSEFEGSFTMKSGIIPYDGWDDNGDDHTSGGGFVQSCKNVFVLEIVGCPCYNHKSACLCPQGQFYYKAEIKEVCEWVYVGSEGTFGNSGTGGTGNTNTGGGNPTNSGGNVITTPINDVIPDGANAADFINYTLSEHSPFNVDMTQVLDSISLPPNDSTKIANEKFLCLYNKLATSNTFKNLFTNVFGSSQDVLNIEFKITKDLKHNGEKVNGLRSVKSGTRNSSTGEITKLNQLIEIDQGLLTSNSNYNTIKTIIHESIHAYLTLKKLDCTNFTSFGQFNNDDICETINTFYDNFNCNGNQSQHEFMFDYMLPVFKSIFEEIGKTNLTSQGSIDYVKDNQLYLDNNPSVDWSWNDFYHYFPMQGLHNTDSFENEIQNDSLKNDLYNGYRDAAKNFTKNCI